MATFPTRLLLAAMLASILAADPLPRIETETLAGKPVELPEAAKGQPTLLIIGFTKGSRAATKAWNDRVEHDIAKLSVYTIVVMEESMKPMRTMAVRSVKKATPASRRDRTLLVYHYEKELKIITDFGRPDDAYLLLLDANGEMKWKSHGPPGDDAIQALQAALQ